MWATIYAGFFVCYICYNFSFSLIYLGVQKVVFFCLVCFLVLAQLSGFQTQWFCIYFTITGWLKIVAKSVIPNNEDRWVGWGFNTH